MTTAAFRSSFLRRQPWAGPGVLRGVGARLGWPLLDAVLPHPACDALVVAKNRVLPVVPPRSLAALRALMVDGAGVVLRRTEHCAPELRRIADRFATDLPGEVHVQIFVTPGGTHGFGWHYDAEDVFIAQLCGCKEYYFRPNTLGGAACSAAEFARYGEETAPMGAATLVAGDCLYIPARWWHVALCSEDALSISVGVLPRPDTAPAPA